MKKKRVVITGLGVASCFGTDVDHFYNQLLAGHSGARLIDTFDCSEYPTRFAAAVKDFSAEGYLDKKQARRVDPVIAYGVVAGKKALHSAGLTDLSSLDKRRCGVIIGSGMGGMQTYTDGVITVKEKGYKRLTPFFIPYIITNMPGGILAIELGFMGPNYSISTACATGVHSIISAANHIRSGDVDLMLCGGTESIDPIGFAGFVAIKALSERNEAPEKASRPWDQARDGFVMGEGSGVLVLESLEHALARGAPILAEYHGGFVNCDAYHMTEPRPDGSGVAFCIEQALKDGSIAPERVNYVNAHATSTVVGDLCEVRAVKTVLGENITMNATKSAIGHSLGAAGGIESVATVCAIHQGRVHPTLNCDNPESELGDIDIVRGKAKSMEIDVALKNSFGFGGHNAVAAFGKYHP